MCDEEVDAAIAIDHCERRQWPRGRRLRAFVQVLLRELEFD